MPALLNMTLAVVLTGWSRSPADSIPASSRLPAAASDSTAAGPAGHAETAPSESQGVASRVPWVAAASDSQDAEMRPVDYLWVLRSALADRASIDSVVARARSIGARGLLVQVVGRGDAWYRSDLLPRPEALRHAAPDFDPLGELLALTRPAGLQVHAWMNCMLVWSAPWWPRDLRHVLNEHPEWVTGMRDGRRMTQLSEAERRRLSVEGVFLSPAHPRVRTWLARVASEIASRYPVDGIHLDYIRQPGVPVGYDPTTRARFAMETGIDPERLDGVAAPERRAADSAWKAFQQSQVTLAVREVRDSLRAVRPGLILSAAVVADTLRAERDNAQCWREWVRDSVLDRVFLMCYAPSVQTVMDQLVATRRELGATARVIPGIAVFNTGASAAALKIKGARTLGFPRIALYSYDALYSRPSGWERLRERLEPEGAGTLGGTSP